MIKAGDMSKLIGVVTCVALALAPMAAAQDDDISSPTLRIEWAEFKTQYDAKSIDVIDVRGEDAYAAGRIPGARLVPLAEIERSTPELIADLKKGKKPIVLYCA